LVNFLENRNRSKFIHLKLSLMKNDVFLCQFGNGDWWSQAEPNIEENWMELWSGGLHRFNPKLVERGDEMICSTYRLSSIYSYSGGHIVGFMDCLFWKRNYIFYMFASFVHQGRVDSVVKISATVNQFWPM
jgi:hypothetical protein